MEKSEVFAERLFKVYEIAIDFDPEFSKVLWSRIKTLPLPRKECEVCHQSMDWFDFHLNQGFCPSCRLKWIKDLDSKEP